MLTALDKGVKGGKWFSLMDKVYKTENLAAAWEKVQGNKGSSGIDKQTVHAFARRADEHLTTVAEELRAGKYQTQAVRRVYIPKPGSKERRPLGIPTVTDRVVQTALRNAIEPVFEKKFTSASYGFRPERGCKDALRKVQQLLNEGYTWVVDADIEKYFDTIDHELLMAEVEKDIADGNVLALIRQYLRQPIMDDMERWEAHEGTPQGAVMSPLLANIYLHPVDVALQTHGSQLIRYADDLVILCRSQEEAERALELLRALMQERKLRLHPVKTRIVDATQRGGFDFLGYHFERGYRWPRKKSIQKLRGAIRAKTRRTNGKSLAAIIADINPVLRGWFQYFKHSHTTTFPAIDGWIRMRLRSILRKRRGGRGCGRGCDHQRWPNAYFQAQSLFTMTEAHALLRQSS
jgi:RNA-directed DNA polymerase